MVVVIFSGYIYDIVGRKYTLLACFLFSSASSFVIPFTSPYLYSWFLIIRIFFGVSQVSIYANPLINDYVEKEYRGRAHAIQNFGITIGSLISTGILFNFTSDLDPRLSFSIVALLNLVFGISIFLMVKEPVDIKEPA